MILNRIFLLPFLDLKRVPSSLLCEFHDRKKEEFSYDFKSNFILILLKPC